MSQYLCVDLQTTNFIYSLETDLHLGTKLWKNVLISHGEQYLNNLISLPKVVENLTIVNLETTGTINSINFKDMLRDTIFKNDSKSINSSKLFENLEVISLSSTSINMNNIHRLLENMNTVFQVNEDIDLPEGMNIENIRFHKYLNDISTADLELHKSSMRGDQLTNDFYFANITVYGEAFIVDGLLNNINITHLAKSAVKINEPFDFDAVTFGKVFTKFWW